MKSKVLLGFAVTTLLLTATVLNSCKKEEPDLCEGVTCLNGGTCVNGECDCPEGYTGPDCGKQDTPSKIRISKIKITKFPSYNNGSDWDTWSAGPDIYVTIYKGTTLIHKQPTMYEDADATQDYIYTPSGDIDLTDPTAKYTISLYDYDSLGDDDFMGGIYFYPYSSTGGFPSTINVNAGGDVSFELNVSYVW